jgi:uncharacterized protein with PQ loop repeat
MQTQQLPSLAVRFNILVSFLTKFMGFGAATTTQSTLKEPVKALKWFVFREDCFDTFFTHKDFMNAECIKFSISKLLGYLIIAGAFIIKVPQIIKIFKKKSVAGISKYLFYIEVSGNSFLLRFSLNNFGMLITCIDSHVLALQWLQYPPEDSIQRLWRKLDHLSLKSDHRVAFLELQQKHRSG